MMLGLTDGLYFQPMAPGTGPLIKEKP